MEYNNLKDIEIQLVKLLELEYSTTKKNRALLTNILKLIEKEILKQQKLEMIESANLNDII